VGETDGGDRIPVVSTVGDALEQLVFGRYARPYRWFVRALTLFVLAGVVQLLLFVRYTRTRIA